ncbi:ArsR/SmtB family transcription factor [Radicibacter daui]|uniref:ArsR/SmtB family transcription factor n=1 Tax=Radicibacter daui TaxID=3064829 RepID=UPI0040468DA9
MLKFRPSDKTIHPATGLPLDRLFHALGDGARLGMVERLSAGPATVSELAAPLAMSLPAVLQHLKVLEESGLVLSEKQGRVRTCRLDPAAMSGITRWVEERKALWNARFDRLGEFLAAEAAEDGTEG